MSSQAEEGDIRSQCELRNLKMFVLKVTLRQYLALRAWIAKTVRQHQSHHQVRGGSCVCHCALTRFIPRQR